MGFGMHDTFDSIRADIETRLSEGASDRHSALHTPVLATGDADSRVLVLRAFDAERWTLRFHTDARSPKVTTIERDPRVGVLGYDAQAKLQLRLRGRGRICREGAEVDAAWEQSTNFARRCYLGDAPGEVSSVPTSGLPEKFEGVEPDAEDLTAARANFALLLVEVDEADWFSLAHTGHRRAVVTRTDGRWIAP